MNSWIEVVDHWKQGTVYPHWAALAHYGYGEARFIFYPPFSWTLGGLLGLILPWKLVPAAYTWIVLTLAGCSMFALAKSWLSRRDAIFAAMLYCGQSLQPGDRVLAQRSGRADGVDLSSADASVRVANGRRRTTRQSCHSA